ncbi:MAG: TIGR00730 family Rossman fold protein [Blastocatellia bacterium]
MNRICVFCGSSDGARPEYAAGARALAATLTSRKIGLVYGGSNVGLMKIIADEMMRAGSEVIGVIPESLVRWEVAHESLTQLHIVSSMHERKALMADLSDGFIAMPGGFGTFEEFCEIITWAQLGIHRKPCGLLNVAGYYDALLAMFDHATREQFVRPQYRRMVLEADAPDRLLDLMAEYEPPEVARWIDRSET